MTDKNKVCKSSAIFSWRYRRVLAYITMYKWCTVCWKRVLWGHVLKWYSQKLGEDFAKFCGLLRLNTSLCFISNTVNEGLVAPFSKFHSRCLALLNCCLTYFPQKIEVLLLIFLGIWSLFIFSTYKQGKLVLVTRFICSLLWYLWPNFKCVTYL